MLWWYGIKPFDSLTYGDKIFENVGTPEQITRLMKSITNARQYNLDHPQNTPTPGTLRHMMMAGVTFFQNPRRKATRKALNSKYVCFLAGSDFENA